MNFKEIGLKEELVNAVLDLGYKSLTPVQEKSIPFLLDNKNNLIALAQTGTGKTAAFSLPILNNINLKNKSIQALILCPTRELCLQIEKDINSFSKHTKGIKSLAIYGGANIEGQIRGLRKKDVQIIVGTPGRTIDLLRRKKLDFSHLEYLVLDEADEMLSMGFKEDLDTILKTTPEEKQTLLFSATMPPDIEKISKKYMVTPHKVSVAKRNEGSNNISHLCYLTTPRNRYEVLKRIVDYNPGIYGIIFCRTRAETKEVAEKLMKDGYNAEAIHGDLSQAQRDYVMKLFREKHLSVLIATDVAARGIDVKDLTHVINYKLPDDSEVYVHRSGRTGRAGSKGISIAIGTSSEKRKLSSIERMMSGKFDIAEIPVGKDICEKQLFHLIDKINNIEVNEKQIEKYLEKAYKKFEHLNKEELIKKMISIEFNRFLDYYKNSKDINNEKGGRDSGSRDRKNKNERRGDKKK